MTQLILLSPQYWPGDRCSVLRTGGHFHPINPSHEGKVYGIVHGCYLLA